MFTLMFGNKMFIVYLTQLIGHHWPGTGTHLASIVIILQSAAWIYQIIIMNVYLQNNSVWGLEQNKGIYLVL